MTSVARVSLTAIERNVTTMAACAPAARCCAVVKADGYGHGAVPVARAALAAGATWLAVAEVAEAAALRAAGIEAPILLLSEPVGADDATIDRAIGLACTFAVYRDELVSRLAARARALGAPPVPVHLKIDTGMRRVGCEPTDAVARARHITETDGVRLDGTMTHLARADEPDDPTTDAQLDRFDEALAAMRAAGIEPGIVHAANSAATIAHPRSHHDLVRVGIAMYGIAPAPAMAGAVPLTPALTWTSTVGLVKRVPAGDAVSYGHRYRFDADTWVATVPVGYADGLRRRLGLVGGEVLIGGRRRPIRGVITMDQCVVELGPDADGVAVGDEVVVVGDQGVERISAADMAGLLETIGYEVTCAISPRVPRVHA